MNRLRLAALALALVLLPMGAAATPADTVDTPTPEGFVQAELLHSLTSDSVALQERAMRRIRAYAHTERYDNALFHDLVTPLHEMVADGPTVHMRLMALSALDAIGSDVAMLGLQVQKDRLDSDLVRQATERVLARYAAEHTDDTQRTRAAE